MRSYYFTVTENFDTTCSYIINPPTHTLSSPTHMHTHACMHSCMCTRTRTHTQLPVATSFELGMCWEWKCSLYGKKSKTQGSCKELTNKGKQWYWHHRIHLQLITTTVELEILEQPHFIIQNKQNFLLKLHFLSKSTQLGGSSFVFKYQLITLIGKQFELGQPVLLT